MDEAQYQADSWDRARRVIIKAKVLPKRPNIRFVVTTRAGPQPALSGLYTYRGGDAEGPIEAWAVKGRS